MATSADADLNVDPEVADAVDILVEEYGREQAEAQLRERFKGRDKRSIPELSYLRFRYGGDDE